MSWQTHPAALEKRPEALIELFTSHLHLRLLLDALVEEEHRVMEEITAALVGVPEPVLEKLVARCVEAAAARVAPS
jgi:hypothetical protein